MMILTNSIYLWEVNVLLILLVLNVGYSVVGNM